MEVQMPGMGALAEMAVLSEVREPMAKEVRLVQTAARTLLRRPEPAGAAAAAVESAQEAAWVVMPDEVANASVVNYPMEREVPGATAGLVAVVEVRAKMAAAGIKEVLAALAVEVVMTKVCPQQVSAEAF